MKKVRGRGGEFSSGRNFLGGWGWSIGVYEFFFHLIFPCANIFCVLRPPNKFSNGSSLMHLFVRACSNLFRIYLAIRLRWKVTLGKINQVYIVEYSYFMENGPCQPSAK